MQAFNNMCSAIMETVNEAVYEDHASINEHDARKIGNAAISAFFSGIEQLSDSNAQRDILESRYLEWFQAKSKA